MNRKNFIFIFPVKYIAVVPPNSTAHFIYSAALTMTAIHFDRWGFGVFILNIINKKFLKVYCVWCLELFGLNAELIISKFCQV